MKTTNTYRCAIDFGTSNSVMYVLSDTGETTFISEPTVLFFPDRKTSDSPVIYVGHEAVSRSVSMGMRGRFIQSIKSVLHDPDFDYTRIAGVPYSPVELVSMILSYLKKKMEEKIGATIESVTLGRPVQFSENPKEDELAQKRLRVAAGLSGFKEISFQLEPIGAAYAYEVRLTHPQTVLVVDLGGGTTDFTIMKLDPAKRGTSDRSQDILATGGVHIGGDDFDSSIMWNHLTDFFGRGSKYEVWGKLYDFPVYFFTTLCTWYDIAKLKEDNFKEDLKSILRTSTDKESVGHLKALIDNDLGYAVYKSIESAKKDLSTCERGIIEFESDYLTIDEMITAQEFESYMKAFIERIDIALSETLDRAGCGHAAIDSVLLTGGSSLVAMVQRLIAARFGEAKMVRDHDCFNTVALGLALYNKSL